MVRHGSAAEPDERPATSGRSASHGRLAAMGLAQPPGWVPGPLALPAAQDRVESPAPDGVASRGQSASRPSPAAPTVGALARAWVEDRLPPWAPSLLDRVRVGSVVAALAALVAVILAGVLLLHHHSAGGYSSSYDASATGSAYGADPVVSAVPSPMSQASSIVVDVGGRVRKPGLVTLPAGARVADAIAAAGGPLHHKEIAMLDLAARVGDGQLLLVGVKSAPPDGTAASTADGTSTEGSAGPVSLSTATIDELETLPGVGPVTAQKIIDWRTSHNGFTTIAQLQGVPGIGPARYAELSPLVTP
jgi:competence protein ComEA